MDKNLSLSAEVMQSEFYSHNVCMFAASHKRYLKLFAVTWAGTVLAETLLLKIQKLVWNNKSAAIYV